MRLGEQKAWALRGTESPELREIESPEDDLSKQIRKVLSTEYRWGVRGIEGTDNLHFRKVIFA